MNNLYKGNPFEDFPYEDMMFWPDLTALLQKLANFIKSLFGLNK